jgi:hypothetical protein
MYCVIQFYVQLRAPLAEHSPFLKVLAIKLVIFLSFWQTAAISVGTSTLNIVHPNEVLAYPDLKVGIPSLLLCFEMALFSILHLWAFPYRPYLDNAKPTFYPVPDGSGLPPLRNEHQPRAGGFLGLKALWDAVNVWDVVKAFGRGMRWLFVGVKRRHEDVSYTAARKNSATTGGGVDMDDLKGAANGKGPGRFAQVHTAYAGMAHHPAGAKSTDHLPIATEFRRSRFGIEGQDGGGGGDDTPPEQARLIAHAQPNPHSPARSADEYSEGYDGSSPYHPPQQQQQQQLYPLHDRPSSLSTVEEESYSRAASAAGGQYAAGGGPGSRGNPRNSTQMKVGNALWGGR